MHRILYYTLAGETARERELLDAMGLAQEVELVGCAHEPYTSPTARELAGCEGVIGEFAPVTREVARTMAEAGVRVVTTLSIGLNHMDVDALTSEGIVVTNCPGYCTEDVALHAVALMLDLMRKVTFSNRTVLAGAWDPVAGYQPYRPQRGTLGLVFFGSIARAVVPIAQALGMRVLVWAPTKTAEELAAAGCEKAETLDDLLRAADVVSLHCPLIPLTERLIGRRELALMKPTAYLVNTARGGVVDEDALADALDAAEEGGAAEPVDLGEGVTGTRGIRAAGLDVLTDEEHPNRRLIEHPRCVVTPHAAYDSRESTEALRTMSLTAMADALVRGVTPETTVNPAAAQAQGLAPRG